MNAKAIKFSAPEALFPPVADSSRLRVACRRVACAVEDCDAHVLNLNVVDTMSQVPADTSLSMLFDLRVSHRSAESVARSLERYGYTVLLVRNADGADSDTLRQRMDGLLRYLDL